MQSTLQKTARSARITLLACAALFSLRAAQAHTPYLLPTSFDAQPNTSVSVDAGYAEKFFLSEVAFGDTRFTVTGPDGKEVLMPVVHQFKTRTVAEFPLPAEKEAARGTWRFSTGLRMGRVFRSWQRNGQVERASSPEQAMPADAKLLAHYQTVAQAESYVTVGAPSRAALKGRGTGLEIVPITHPGDLYVGENFDFAVHFDGQPLAGNKIEIYRSRMDMASEHSMQPVTTDAQGHARFPLRQSGVYLALVRHDAKAPAGASAPNYGHRYTLSFRVLDR